MVGKRSFFIIIAVLALASFIYADYYTTTPYVSPGGIAFLAPTLAYNCSYTNFSYLIINVSGWVQNNPTVAATNTSNLTIYTYNATGGIFNITNITSSGLNASSGAIWLTAPDGTYNISLNVSNLTFSNFTSLYNITVDTKNPNITLTYPLANANLSFFNITINSTYQDIYLNYTLITVYNASGSTVGNNIVLRNNVNASVNFTTDGRYAIFASAYDRAGNVNMTSRNITVDTTTPVIVVYSPLNNTNYYVNQQIMINFGAVEVNPFNYWYSNGSNGVNISFTAGNINNISYDTAGWYNLSFSANDSAAHLTNVRMMINIVALPGTSIVANSSASTLDVNSTVSTVVVPYNSTLNTVTVTNSSQLVSLDLSQLLVNGVVTLGSNETNYFNLISGSGNNYIANIANGTVITGGSAWDGKINLPAINSSSFTAPSGTTNVVVDLGSSIELNFSYPVEIVLAGMAGKSAAWSRGSLTLTNITTHCVNTSIDGIMAQLSQAGPRECYIDDGADLLIATLHFSTFSAYTPAAAVATPAASGGGSASTTTPQNLTSGYNKLFSTGDVLSFPFDARTYMFMLLYTKGSNATIQFSPNTQSATLATGEERTFDLNKDGKKDISVKINSVSGIKADVTLKFITETAVVPAETPAEETGVGAMVTQTAENIAAWSLAKKITVGVGVIIVIALVVLGIIFLRKNSKGNRVKEHIKTFEFARK